jgi:hypothetical protein
VSRRERCESGMAECGPVVRHDTQGVPLCQKCWDEMANDPLCHADECPCALCTPKQAEHQAAPDEAAP